MPRARSRRPARTSPQNDEIAVPSVHLVEAAAGNHVLVLQVQQAGSDLGGIDLSGRGNNGRQGPHLHLAALLQVLHRRSCRKISRQVQHRSLGQLGINHGLAIRHGAGQSVPARGYVGQDWREARFWPDLLASAAKVADTSRAQSQDQKKNDKGTIRSLDFQDRG